MLSSSNSQLAIDAGSFSIKSVTGKWKSHASFSGKVGNYVLCTKTENGSAGVESDIHQSITPIYGKRQDIYTAVALADVIVREITVADDLSDHDLEGAIEVELRDALPFDADQVYFDYTPFVSADADLISDESRYLVVASRRDVVDKLTDSIKTFDKKLASINVDIAAYAMGRLVSQLYNDFLQDGLIMLVDIGHQRSRFYIYDAHNLVFSREQQIGGKYVTDSIAEIYDLNVADSEILKHSDEHDSEFEKLITVPFCATFAEQFHLVMDFFEASSAAHKQIAKAVFVGGGSCLSGFVPELEKLLDIPIELIDLTPAWSANLPDGWSDQTHFSAQYALAISLLADGGV